MNLYAVSLFGYALLIAPLRLRFSALLNHKLLMRWGVSAYGLPLILKKIRPKDKKKSTGKSPGPPELILMAVFRRSEKPHRSFLHVLLRQDASIQVQLRFEDAAVTALVYALINTLYATLEHIGMSPHTLSIDIRGGFGQGAVGARVTGILRLRLGTLLYASALLGLSVLKVKWKKARENRRKQWSIQSTT